MQFFQVGGCFNRFRRLICHYHEPLLFIRRLFLPPLPIPITLSSLRTHIHSTSSHPHTPASLSLSLLVFAHARLISPAARLFPQCTVSNRYEKPVTLFQSLHSTRHIFFYLVPHDHKEEVSEPLWLGSHFFCSASTLSITVSKDASIFRASSGFIFVSQSFMQGKHIPFIQASSRCFAYQCVVKFFTLSFLSLVVSKTFPNLIGALWDCPFTYTATKLKIL